MKHQNLNYVVVGSFVLAMLVAALGAVVMLAGGAGPRDHYIVVLDNVADVKFGTQVRYEGYPVGQVESIEPVAENGAMVFRLDVSVQEGWVIPADSVARIQSSQFLSAKTVDISRGKATTALAPGDRIASAPPADIFAAMASVAGQFGELSRDGLMPLLARLGDLVGNANRLLDNDVAPLLGSLNAVATDARGQIPQIAGRILSLTEELNTTVVSLQSVLSQENVTEVRQTVHNVNAVSGQFVEISQAVQGTLLRLDGIVAQLQDVVEKNRDSVDASVDDTRYILRSIAQNIDAINHNLAGTARNMNEFSRLIRQNPSLLLGGSPREDVNVDTAPPRTSRSQTQ